MKRIFEKIEFEGHSYSELTDDESRSIIEKVVAKLKPLEDQISEDPKGIISVFKSGKAFSSMFETSLATKITKLLQQ